MAAIVRATSRAGFGADGADGLEVRRAGRRAPRRCPRRPGRGPSCRPAGSGRRRRPRRRPAPLVERVGACGSGSAVASSSRSASAIRIQRTSSWEMRACTSAGSRSAMNSIASVMSNTAGRADRRQPGRLPSDHHQADHHDHHQAQQGEQPDHRGQGTVAAQCGRWSSRRRRRSPGPSARRWRAYSHHRGVDQHDLGAVAGIGGPHRGEVAPGLAAAGRAAQPLVDQVVDVVRAC